MIALALLLAAAAPAAPPPPPPAATPAATPAPVDPVRLAVAERVVLALVPPGTYARIMRDQLPQIVDMMMGRFGGMTPADLGVPATEGTGPGPTFAEAMAASDPAFRERMTITNRVMFEELGKVMSAIEPRLRVGLARAFARKFDAQQLADMNAFFATPSGGAFAREYLAAFVDPDVMREMMGALPEMIQAMPAIGAKVEAATAHLPKPKTPTPEAAAEDKDAIVIEKSGE